MKLINYLLLAFILVCTISCNNDSTNAASTSTTEAGKNTFNQYGISFSFPADWEVTEAEDMPGGYYISCEKQGLDESGMVIVLAYKEIISQEEAINGYLESVAEEGTWLGLKFQPITASSYGDKPSKASTYTTAVMGVPHNGTVLALDYCGKTILIIEHVADEDAQKSASGFEAIKNTFSCS